MSWQRVLAAIGPSSPSWGGAAGVACDCVEALDADRRRSNIRWMAEAHTEAVQALLRLIEAEGRIVTDAERAQADVLVAFVEDGDLPMARVLFRQLFGFADEHFRHAAWAVVEALMARARGRR